VRRGLVLGCGGTVGGAWTVGALSAVAEALDWDPCTAAVIVGTSSGSSIAALLGAGIGVGELVAAQRDDPLALPAVRSFFRRPPGALPPLPAPRPTSVPLSISGLRRRAPLPTVAGLLPTGTAGTPFLYRLADAIAPRGWVTHPQTWIVAADLGTGRRVAFGRDDAPAATLGAALSASWAVPGWFRPVTAQGRRYADGGIVSPTSADLLVDADLDEVVIVAPMASLNGARVPGLGGRVEGVLRTRMDAIVEAEVATLRRSGVAVRRVHPGRASLKRMGPNFMDPARRLAALDAGQSADVDVPAHPVGAGI
jgi:NTE family protein